MIQKFFVKVTPFIFHLKPVLTNNLPEKIYYSSKAFSSA